MSEVVVVLDRARRDEAKHNAAWAEKMRASLLADRVAVMYCAGIDTDGELFEFAVDSGDETLNLLMVGLLQRALSEYVELSEA